MVSGNSQRDAKTRRKRDDKEHERVPMGKKKGMKKVIAPREEGRLGMSSIEARNKTIQVMWLKKFLAKLSMKSAWA